MSHLLVLALTAAAATASAQATRPPTISMPADSSTEVQARQRLREGQRLMELDKFDDAARAFQEAITFNPLLVTAHYGLGTARMGLKEYPAAVVAFEAARASFQERVALDARNRIETDNARQARIWRMQSSLRDVLGPYGEERSQRSMQAALAELVKSQEEGKRLPQPPPGLFLALGSAYFRTGRLADAEREYRAAIEVEPKLGEPHNNLAVVLLITGRVTEAKEQLTLAEQNGFKPEAQLKADIEKAQVSAPARIP